MAFGYSLPFSPVLVRGGWPQPPALLQPQSVPQCADAAACGALWWPRTSHASGSWVLGSFVGPAGTLGVGADFKGMTRVLRPNCYYMLVSKCFLGAAHRVNIAITIHSFIYPICARHSPRKSYVSQDAIKKASHENVWETSLLSPAAGMYLGLRTGKEAAGPAK